MQLFSIGFTEPKSATGLFGSSTSDEKPAAGLFGSAPSSTTGGLFGSNKTDQPSTGGGLFGSGGGFSGLGAKPDPEKAKINPFGASQGQIQVDNTGLFGGSKPGLEKVINPGLFA